MTKTMAIDTARLKESIDLIELAGRYTELHRKTAKEYGGPCPFCGGNDRFYVTADRFACRQCQKSGDAIEFMRLQNNVGFLDAVSMLGADVLPTAEKVKPVAKVAASPDVWDEPCRRDRAMKDHEYLMAGQGGKAIAALAYLQGRGIDRAALEKFKVGCGLVLLPDTWDAESKRAAHPAQLAVGLPWFNLEGALQCVKYRFTEAHTYTDKFGKKRTEAKKGSGDWGGQMFGWQALQGPIYRPALIICEGEMNALSLWQVCGDWADVLSAGSQAGVETLPRQVYDLAFQYQHRIVWADKGTIADKAAASIGAASMRSPTGPDGKEMDANVLLQAGKLAGLVEAIRQRLGIEAETLTHISAVGCTVTADELSTLQSQATAAGRELHTEADGDGFYILRNVPIGAKLWHGFVVKQ